jgi:hypothetical protein
MKRVWIRVERICCLLHAKNWHDVFVANDCHLCGKAKLHSWKEVVKRLLLVRC